MTPAASAIEHVRICIRQGSASTPSDARDKRVIQQLLDAIEHARDLANFVHEDSAQAVRLALDKLDGYFSIANRSLLSAELQDLVLDARTELVYRGVFCE